MSLVADRATRTRGTVVEIAGWAPEELLEWAASRYSPRIAMATGFGAEGCVLVDMIATRGLPIEVLTLDTGLLFPETYELWARLESVYGLTIRAVAPERTVAEQAVSFGDALWRSEPDMCCEMRKVIPLRRELAKLDAWVTAVRRDQTPARARAQAIETDERFGLVKVNPLVAFSERDVWSYIRERGVPHSSLHERGYRSIGCAPCTSPVASGEDSRAGRWRGSPKTECGLHARPATLDLQSTTQASKG
jgi:phosphoadenylyl-sulfate reductase (thioredoxin)